MQKDKQGEPQPGPEEPLRPPKQESLVPAVAVAAVVVVALATAIFVKRGEPVESQASTQTPAAAAPMPEVVKAPPLKAAPAPAPVQARGEPQSRAGDAMGAGAACRNCGIVEMVVAVHGHAMPTASGYQMHIRMDDGTVRTVEQRGALAAGSRVMVEGASVRALSTEQG
jgi:ferric-dicitrate binding protein FerR (iron transport regulator)